MVPASRLGRRVVIASRFGWIGRAGDEHGEREEERVEQAVAREHIEAHQDAADSFVWAGVAVLLLMVVPLMLPGGRARQAASVGALVGTLAVLALGYRVGEAGARLVYQHGAAQAYVTNGGGGDVVPASGDSQAK